MLLEDILKLSKGFGNCLFSFYHREGNVITITVEIEWRFSFPVWLVTLVKEDVGAGAPDI